MASRITPPPYLTPFLDQGGNLTRPWLEWIRGIANGTIGGISYVDGEIPGGIVDGINAVFILENTPNPLSSLMVFRNGMKLRRTVGYTINATTLTFLAPQIPQTGDDIEVSYRF